MEYYYSAVRNVFFDENTWQQITDTAPLDLIPVPYATVLQFSRSPEPGMRRVADADGLPSWQGIPGYVKVPVIDEIVQAQIQQQRDDIRKAEQEKVRVALQQIENK